MGGFTDFLLNAKKGGFRPHKGLQWRRLRAVIFGDSLSDGGASGRAAGIYDGRPYYGSTTVVTPANFGGLTWLYDAKVDGRAAATGNGIGTIETDATARMRWTYQGDTPGPWTDVSTGGFFLLPTGTLVNNGIFVRIRGGTAGVANASSLVNTAGIPSISDYNLLGYVPWLVGQLGSAFADYQTFAIPGATSTDVLKFMPQGLVTALDLAILVFGTNDLPDTAVKAQASIDNMKAAIDLARSKATYVIVYEPPPNINASPTVNMFMGRVGDQVSAYCTSLKGNVEYSSGWDRMIASNAPSAGVGSTAGGRPGAYFDDIHFMPFGASEYPVNLVAAVLRRFPRPTVRRNTMRTWDATVKAGTWNANSGLLGTAGTFGGTTPTAAGNGVTGTVPDGYVMTRYGGATPTQQCVITKEPDPAGGLGWLMMEVMGSSSGDYHELSQQFNVPAGVVPGTDFFSFMVEQKVVSTTGGGLVIYQAQAVSGGNIQSTYVFQIGRAIANFTSEGPALELRGEAQRLLSGVTLFTIRVRVGAAVGGGGKIGLRLIPFERVPGPIYP